MTQEQIEKIGKFEQILLKGYYANSAELVALYNEVMKKNARPTQCSTCLRNYTRELIAARNAFLKAQEASKQDEPTTTPTEENKVITEAKNKPKGGRKKIMK